MMVSGLLHLIALSQQNRAMAPNISHSSYIKSEPGEFCIDLTERARAGEIDPAIGRENEIRTMVAG